MTDEERDLVEFENDAGEKVSLRVQRYFYYNGEEYVLLTEDLTGDDGDDAAQYIMRVAPVEGEEDMEEFLPIDDDALLEKLIHALETVQDEDDYSEDDD